MKKRFTATLKSVGGLLSRGRFASVYSRHSEVVNFLAEGVVLTVGTARLCPGPYRIVLNTDRVDEIEVLELGEEYLKLNEDMELEVAPEQVYNYRVFSTMMESPQIAQQINAAREVFWQKSSPDCVAKLISSAAPGQDGFVSLVGERFSQGRELLEGGKYPEAVLLFRRTGLGLTPAGDDFLIGLVLGLGWIDRCLQKETLSEIRDVIFYESRSKDPLINTFLLQSRDLTLDEDWAKFLVSLGAQQGDWHPWLEQILSHGATSGADQLSGFFAAWEIFGAALDITSKDKR